MNYYYNSAILAAVKLINPLVALSVCHTYIVGIWFSIPRIRYNLTRTCKKMTEMKYC